MAFCISTHDLPAIDNYAEALGHYRSVRPVRGRDPLWRPIGSRRNWNKQMASLPGGDVVFELFSRCAVVYHPDGTVTLTLTDRRSVSPDIFTAALAPGGLRTSARQGMVMCSAAVCPLWLRNTEGTRHGANPAVTCYALSSGTSMRFETTPTGWRPVPDQKLSTINYSILDRAHARALVKEYRLAELRTWVLALTKLGGELPPFAPFHGDNLRLGYQAARAGDFHTAASYLPFRVVSAYTVAGGWTSCMRITDACFRLVRMQLYRDHGALAERSVTSMSLPDWLRCVARNRY